MQAFSLSILAVTYGSNSYDSSTYGSGATQSTTGASSGGLTNTGIAIASFVTIACIVLLIAVLVRFWRRPGKNSDASADS